MQETIQTALLVAILAGVTYVATSSSQRKLQRKQGRPIFVDTSVLIDGRIIPLARSGFLSEDVLYVPRSVVGELQYLADNADNEKRSRARHGLDNINELQAITTVTVKVFQDGDRAEEGVDSRLINLAKRYHGAVCTIDYNLNKVAQVEGVTVLNINDLAMGLRMAYLPGERVVLELIQKGNDSHQAVGHLPDGTMVVVEHASQLIGSSAEIEFIRGLQTAAGRMMFAKLVDNGAKPAKPSQTQRRGNKSQPSRPNSRPAQSRKPQKPANKGRNTQSPRPRTTTEQREEDLINLLNSQ